MRKLVAITVLTGCLAATVMAGSPAFEHAQTLYKQTDYPAALKLLLGDRNGDSDWLELTGKSYFMLGDFKKATEYFDKAVQQDSNRSSHVLWLGRAYGRRAESGNPLTAPGYANKARKCFERAVELDPRNGEALNDLFDYYLEAPGFLGGGYDKASSLVDRIGDLDQAERHYARARLFEKRKDYADAEQQLRTAAAMAPRQVGRLIDLAKFLARHGKPQESDALFQAAYKVAPNSPKVMYHQAAILIETRRDLNHARELLDRYLKSPLTPDDPSREEAARLLRQAGS